MPSLQFLGLVLALTMIFFMGGSSRDDVQSLVILNPLMIIFCAVAATTLKKQHLKEKKWIFTGFFLIFLIVVFYILPLPGEFDKLSRASNEMDKISVTADIWGRTRILAITPHAALQSVFSLFAPLAVFLFAIQLNRVELEYTFPVIIFLGSISAFIGILQLSGSVNSSLYLYRITNNGSAVGLFANRNHAAVFLACLFPILAIFSIRSIFDKNKTNRAQSIIVISLSFVLILLILATGSRSGLLVTFFGLIGSYILYFSSSGIDRQRSINRTFFPIVVVALLACIIFLAIYFSRATAIERVFTDPVGSVNRSDFWNSSLNLFWEYFPFGFGPGAFAAVFQKDEMLVLLNATYLNRLHNDWLETILTFGIPGAVLLITSLTIYIRRAVTLWLHMDDSRAGVATGRVASVVIIILAIASLSDYPLRTPAMMGFMALVVVWFVDAVETPKNVRQKSPLL